MEDFDKVYYNAGDVVTLRQDIPNKPVMIVIRKEQSIFRSKDDRRDNGLRGMRCRWFTDDGFLQEAIWNTKDLIKLS